LTLLAWAALFKNSTAIKILMSAGADPHFKSDSQEPSALEIWPQMLKKTTAQKAIGLFQSQSDMDDDLLQLM